MKLTTEQIRHVAELARLDLSEADVEGYVRELGAILDYIEKLAQLPTDGVVPTSSVGVDELPVREDSPGACLSPEEVLANAPEVRAGHFRVPRVVE
jgi:aspartyl-tRNA(Asn)/glutamyl-tRNA(Gln) amidotransferase subunit C